MSEFEYVLVAFLVPVVYVLTYIAGKYDLLALICNMLQEKLEEFNQGRDESMTNLEMIKESSVGEMVEFLCTLADCEQCPARELCYDGHNGMREWLEKECGEDE